MHTFHTFVRLKIIYVFSITFNIITTSIVLTLPLQYNYAKQINFMINVRNMYILTTITIPSKQKIV